VQVKISGARVTGVSYITDDFPLPYKLARHKAIGITLQMAVIEDQFLVRAQLINCCSAAFALKEFNNLAIGSSYDWRSRRGRNIDSIVHATFVAGIRECV